MAAAVVVCLGWGPARGAPARDEAQARNHYQAAMTAYDLGRFDQAIESFTRAYQLDPAPILLFNIAQSHRKKGDRERALHFYRRYLEADPRSENRQRVEAHIKDLEAPPSAPPPATTAPPPATPAPPLPVAVERPERPERPILVTAASTERPPLHRRPWVWGAVGAVAVATLVTVFALRSNKPWNCGMDCRTLQVD